MEAVPLPDTEPPPAGAPTLSVPWPTLTCSVMMVAAGTTAVDRSMLLQVDAVSSVAVSNPGTELALPTVNVTLAVSRTPPDETV